MRIFPSGPGALRRSLLQIALLAVIVAVLYRIFFPPPPDLTAAGYTTLSFEHRRMGSQPTAAINTVDPEVIHAFTAAIATGRPAMSCLCAHYARFQLTKPGQEPLYIFLRPGHAPDEVQFDHAGNRYSLDRTRLLAALAPLNIPPATSQPTPTSRPLGPTPSALKPKPIQRHRPDDQPWRRTSR